MSAPFSLANDSDYRAWRAAKLANYPKNMDELVVHLDDPRALSAAEIRALETCCARANMVLYYAPNVSTTDKSVPHQFARQFGLLHLEGNYLADEDGLSSITPASDEERGRGEYVPYTHKSINWHTDGYYRPQSRHIRAMVLHCVRCANTGGENALMDHEMAYIAVREANPDWVHALMEPDAMTIPERLDEDGVARAEQTGPVFSIDPHSGELHMRYTARTRSVQWKDDALTRAAAAFLARLLERDGPHMFRVTLEPGMGLVCNNVLHDRSGFVDDPLQPRLLYRARYLERLRAPRLSNPVLSPLYRATRPLVLKKWRR